MSLPLDGLGGLLLAVGAAVLLYLLVFATMVRRRRRRRPPVRKKGPAVAPAGWYADPTEPQTMRFWNGKKWTDSPAD